MKSTLVVLAVAAVLFGVDSQLFPGLIDDKLADHDSKGVAHDAPLEVDDPNKSDGHTHQSQQPGNDTDVKRPDGDRYFWSRQLGDGETVTERAFALNGSSVIVVKSKDRSLEERNITRATSVYSFQGGDSLVAIIPWGFHGPCLISSTNLSYLEAVDLLQARNGSSFRSTSRLFIDANVAPLSPEEGATFLAENPVLRRWCGFRPIVSTTDVGDNPRPYSNFTEEIITLLLEADISIIIPEQPESPDSPQDVGTPPQRPIEQAARWGYSRDLSLDPATHPSLDPATHPSLDPATHPSKTVV